MGKYPLEPMALRRATKSRGKGTQRTERPVIAEHRPSNGAPSQRWSCTQFTVKVKLLSSLALPARDLKAHFQAQFLKKYFLVWLHRVLAVAWGSLIFDLWSLLQRAGPSFLMRDQTWAPALRSGVLATGLPGKSPGPLYYWLDPHFLYDHVWLVPFKPLFLFGQKSILFPLYHTGHIHKNLSSHLRIKTEHTHTRTVGHSALRCVCSFKASRLLFSTDLKSLCENLLYMNL